MGEDVAGGVFDGAPATELTQLLIVAGEVDRLRFRSRWHGEGLCGVLGGLLRRKEVWPWVK
jgi:hypothetical protein